MKKTPVVMCIDVEPDERLITPAIKRDWAGFELTYEFLSALRPRLEAATGYPVRYCWFLRMDPQIATVYGSAAWVVNRYSSLIRKIQEDGDVIGLHVHGYRWEESQNSWILDFGSDRWIERCIRLGFQSFRESLDQPCRYFRFGNVWMNNAALALVDRLGARFDLSLEPGRKPDSTDGTFTGSFVDYGQVPHHPYRPSRSDFTKPGSLIKRRIWMIPLSSGNTDWTRDPIDPRSPRSTQEEHSRLETTTPASSIMPQGNVLDGMFEGSLDRTDCELISGWVYDPGRPDAALEVEIFDDDLFLTTATAGSLRPDLVSAGKGNGRHSFNVVVPTFLKDGKPHLIRVRVAGTNFHLSNSPRELACCKPDESERFLTLNLSCDPWPLRRIIDNLLNGSDRLYLGLVVRSDVVTQPDQGSNLIQTCDYILSHPLIGELAFETPPEMIRRMRCL